MSAMISRTCFSPSAIAFLLHPVHTHGTSCEPISLAAMIHQYCEEYYCLEYGIEEVMRLNEPIESCQERINMHSILEAEAATVQTMQLKENRDALRQKARRAS